MERLRDLGRWLDRNGEAIYNSVPWKHQNDTKTPDIWYTSKVESTDRITVYAIVLNYPYDADGVDLYALGKAFDNNTEASMLGFPQKLKVRCVEFPTICFQFQTNSFIFFYRTVVRLGRIDVRPVSSENTNRQIGIGICVDAQDRHPANALICQLRDINKI